MLMEGGRPSLNAINGGQQSNNSNTPADVEELLRQTTKDNEMLKHQLH